MKTITGALAALASFLLSAPSSLHQAAGVALYLLAVDTAGGLWLARRTASMTSSAYRMKLRDKLACYGMILALAGGVGVLAQSWAWPVAGFWALCAGESISLGETLRAGMALSNAPWTKPVGELLDRVLGTFQKGDSTDGDSRETSDSKSNGDSKPEEDAPTVASADTSAGA